MAELLFRDDAYLNACAARVTAAGEASVELDRTIFYPMGGGQPGDRGQLLLEDGSLLPVTDTRKGDGADAVVHVLAPDAALPAPGTRLTAQLDWARRYRLMRLHTAMHVLSAIVKAPVTGGRISEDKAHLDFDIDMALLDKEAIEQGVNALIAKGCDTQTRWVSDAELDAHPELVKTMSVAPPRGEDRVRLLEIPGIDLQACGGTHVRNIAEIGVLRVLRIRSEGRRNRRVTLGLAD